MVDRRKPFGRHQRGYWDGPRPVGFGVERVMRHLDAPEPSIVEAVFKEWPALVGEVIAANTRPTRIVDGVLHIDVDNSAWASEMKWMGDELVRQVQTKLQTDEITEIAVRIASEGRSSSR